MKKNIVPGDDPPKLTKIQLATLAYVAMKCEIVTYHPRTGTRPMKKLVELGLLNVVDASYGTGRRRCRQLAWCPTVKGKALVASLGDFGSSIMDEIGWLE